MMKNIKNGVKSLKYKKSLNNLNSDEDENINEKYLKLENKLLKSLVHELRYKFAWDNDLKREIEINKVFDRMKDEMNIEKYEKFIKEMKDAEKMGEVSMKIYKTEKWNVNLDNKILTNEDLNIN